MNIDLKKGDIVLGGKFRNKPYEVASFGVDDHGQPTVITTSGKTIKLLSIRIKKMMEKTVKKEYSFSNARKLKDLMNEDIHGKPPYIWERQHIAKFRTVVPKVKEDLDRMGQINRMEAMDYEPFLKALEELVKLVKSAKHP